MTPYRTVVEKARNALSQEFESLVISCGPRQLAKDFPCMTITVAPSGERAVTLGNRFEKSLILTFDVLYRDYQGKEHGYLELLDLVSEIEEIVRQPNFLESFTSKLNTTSFGEASYHENSFILGATLEVEVDLE
jgi:hypothetical protein